MRGATVSVGEDELFYAEQNARLVKNAEEYYRSMFFGEVSSWNLRDSHMVETLDALVTHLGQQGGSAKVVVWAHNSHLGDARATAMGQRGELNVGHLVREKYGREAVLIGFTTFHGTVTAASDWDGVAERKRVRPALAGSFEALFHSTLPSRFLLAWRDNRALSEALHGPRLERAIGVIYRPETERASHYFQARLSDQFDAVLHFDGPGPSSRSNTPPNGKRASCRRPSPSRSDRWRDRCQKIAGRAPGARRSRSSNARWQFERARGRPRHRPVRPRQRQQPPQPSQSPCGAAAQPGKARDTVGRPVDVGGRGGRPATAQLRFDIGLLAERLVGVTDWLTHAPETRQLRIGYFGASTGAGAALVAAAERPEAAGAVVSRGGRPDLAGPALSRVRAPTLLIVGGNDVQVIALNRAALAQLRCEKHLVIVPGATHLFEEPGALGQVALLARNWFERHLDKKEEEQA